MWRRRGCFVAVIVIVGGCICGDVVVAIAVGGIVKGPSKGAFGRFKSWFVMRNVRD